jgi:hypothetical protein
MEGLSERSVLREIGRSPKGYSAEAVLPRHVRCTRPGCYQTTATREHNELRSLHRATLTSFSALLSQHQYPYDPAFRCPTAISVTGIGRSRQQLCFCRKEILRVLAAGHWRYPGYPTRTVQHVVPHKTHLTYFNVEITAVE